MPTFRHGKNTVFKIDNAAGTLVDISTSCDNVSFPRTIDTGDTSAFGTSAKTYVVGLSDSKISVSGKFDATTDAQIAAVIAAIDAGTLASATFEYGPEGSTTGRVKYTGECLVTSYEISASVSDMVPFSLELQVTGAVTRTTF
jgi:predicted secreted protein